MTSKQMEGKTPIEQAKQAIGHTLNVLRDNWQVGYHLGLGTQAYSLLTEAAATLFGHDLETIRQDFLPEGNGIKSDTEIAREVRGLFNDYRIECNQGLGESAREEFVAKLTVLLREK